MAGYEVRLATTADLARITDIWYQNEIAGEEPPDSVPGPLDTYTWLLAQGDVRVAGADGAVTGFGATLTWPSATGPLTYLTDLFIGQESQSRGLGQALMGALMASVGARCVMASKDPRATALYIRFGMRPRWPNYWLTLDSPYEQGRVAALPGAGLVIAPADVDEELLTWDRACCGFERARDLRWMVERRAAQPYWLARGGERVGYALIQRRCEESLWRPDAWTIGPVGARTVEDAAACMGAITRFAAAGAPAMRLAVPGPHPALPVLLGLGFHIVYIETFLASEGGEPFEAQCYLPGGLFL